METNNESNTPQYMGKKRLLRGKTKHIPTLTLTNPYQFIKGEE
jgi:hypothetical protein